MAALIGEPQAKTDPDQNVVALSAAEQAAARALGMTEAEYIKANKEQK